MYLSEEDDSQLRALEHHLVKSTVLTCKENTQKGTERQRERDSETTKRKEAGFEKNTVSRPACIKHGHKLHIAVAGGDTKQSRTTPKSCSHDVVSWLVTIKRWILAMS